MHRRTLANRYAKVMVELAVERDELQLIREQFEQVVAAIRELPSMPQYFSDKRVPDAERHEAVDLLVKDLALDEIFANFLHVLVKRGRFMIIESISQEYNLLADVSLGIVHVKVTTAIALSEVQKSKILEKFAGIVGGKPVLHEKIDTSLVVGMVVEVDNKVYDSSLSAKLDSLRQKLKGI